MRPELKFQSLQINCRGECDVEHIKRCYQENDFVVFPSLGDEWGLVPIESWASGVPVIGSRFAQSVTTNCKDGENGWIIDPLDRHRIYDALGVASRIDANRWLQMSIASRDSVAGISARASADHFCNLCETVLLSKPTISKTPQIEKCHPV